MVQITVNLSKKTIEDLEFFVDEGYFINRADAVRGFIKKGLEETREKYDKENGVLEDVGGFRAF